MDLNWIWLALAGLEVFLLGFTGFYRVSFPYNRFYVVSIKFHLVLLGFFLLQSI